MPSDQWATALSSLVGAIIGAGAALTAQHMQWRHTRKAESEQEWKLAIVEVLVRAQAVDLRAHDMTLLALHASSLSGLVPRVLGSVSPVDYTVMSERLIADANALNQAAAQVWLFGDDKTVKLTNAVVIAAADVVAAHTTAKGKRPHILAFFGRRSHDEEQIAGARECLAEARRALADHTRQAFRLEHVDLFSLPTAAES